MSLIDSQGVQLMCSATRHMHVLSQGGTHTHHFAMQFYMWSMLAGPQLLLRTLTLETDSITNHAACQVQNFVIEYAKQDFQASLAW